MGISIEFNPDLALRNISEFKLGKRKKEECLPEKPEAGKVYDFLKEGQRSYWLEGEIPLFETKGNYNFSKVLASVVILEATNFKLDGKVYTKGKYKVTEVFNPKESKIHFESYRRLK